MDYSIERYASVRKTHTPSFGAEGDELSFLSDRTGGLEVWSVREAGGWPEQQTVLGQRVTFATQSPVRSEVAFGVDYGGDGQTQLFLITKNKKTRLTDAPTASHRWGGWSNDGNYVAFAANRESPDAFDIFVRPRAPEASPERVFQTDGWYDVLGWGPDDSQLLLRKTTSELDHVLSILDLTTGRERVLSPEPAKYESANWGPDGGVYVVTDHGRSRRYLGRLEPGEETVEEIVTDSSWNVEGLAVHPSSGRLVYGRNVNGYTKVTAARIVAPARIEQISDPKIPRGVAGEVSFDSAGDRFAVTVTTRRESPTVYVVKTETGEAEQWTCPSHGGIPREAFVTPETIQYESHDGLSVPALVSRPAGDGPHPVVVDLHGGPESQRRPSFNPFRQYLLRQGYALLEPNVRGSSGYGEEYAALDDGRKRPDAVEDVRSAVTWLRENDEFDHERVAVVGSSYGGWLALQCLVKHDVWSAGASVAGIVDLVTFLENTGDWRQSLRESEYGSIASDRDFLESISPKRNVTAIDSPTLLIHGANDPRVPPESVNEFAEELRDQKVTVEKHVLEQEGHSISTTESRATVYRKLATFLKDNVRV